MVMSGVPASDGRCTPARPASHGWNASVDVRRRTRRNAYTIRGAAPEVNHRTFWRGSRGSASQPSPNLIAKPRGLFAETLSILLDRFANRSRSVIDRPSSSSRHVRHGISCLQSGFPNVSRCPVHRSFSVGATHRIRRQQRDGYYCTHLLHTCLI